MIGKLKDLMRLAGGEWIVSFTTRDDPRKMFDQFTGKDVNIDIKKASKARTKTANDFCWSLCNDIGNALKPPVPKEEVYRKAISEVGRFELMHMKAEAIPTFRDIWERRGIGWFTQVVDYSQIPGCKIVMAYFGSSTYNTEEMSRLIDYLKQDAENMGIPIPLSKEEEQRLMDNWGKNVSKG
jgi:hypothetical protein